MNMRKLMAVDYQQKSARLPSYLAQHILQGDFSEGDTVLVDAENREIAFTKAPAKAKKAAKA
jgi:hypothetical protein